MADASAAAPAAPAPGPGLAPAAWSERFLAASPLPPILTGLLVAALVLVVVTAMEWLWGDLALALRGEAPRHKLEEYRFTVVFALLAGYLPVAYVAEITGSRRTLEALVPALRISGPALDAHRERMGRFTRRGMRRSGLVGILIAFSIPIVVDLSVGAYRIDGFNPSAFAHRLMLPFVGWLTAHLFVAIVVDSRRLRDISRESLEVDLLSSRGAQPLVRCGLRNALLSLGFFAILALILPDWSARPGLPWVLALGLGLSLLTAFAGLLIPLRGVQQATQDARDAELAWCNAAIRSRRAALEGQGRPLEGARLDELVSYRSLVQAVRLWPIDTSTLVRFLLYLVIPVGSWVGGAMVERVVDRLLQ